MAGQKTTRGALNKLEKVWATSNNSRRTKRSLYKSLVKKALMCGSKIWKMKKSDKQKVYTFKKQVLKLNSQDTMARQNRKKGS